MGCRLITTAILAVLAPPSNVGCHAGPEKQLFLSLMEHVKTFNGRYLPKESFC